MIVLLELSIRTSLMYVEGHDRMAKKIAEKAGKEYMDYLKTVRSIGSDSKIPFGRSRIIPGYDLEKKFPYIIRTSVPPFNNKDSKSSLNALEKCYSTSLELFELYDLNSILFTPFGNQDSDYVRYFFVFIFQLNLNNFSFLSQ